MNVEVGNDQGDECFNCLLSKFIQIDVNLAWKNIDDDILVKIGMDSGDDSSFKSSYVEIKLKFLEAPKQPLTGIPSKT